MSTNHNHTHYILISLIPRLPYHKNTFTVGGGYWEQSYILITLRCLYADLCEVVSNFVMLTAAMQKYWPPSDDCSECSVRDLVVTRPEVCL